jgi:hypothetical protein
MSYPRYEWRENSESGHCCFQSSVVLVYGPDKYDTVCVLELLTTDDSFGKGLAERWQKEYEGGAKLPEDLWHYIKETTGRADF